MDFRTTRAEEEIRRETRAVLAAPAARDWRAALRERPGDLDPVRPLYRALGERHLLAAAWPSELGGRDATHTETAAVVDELVKAGVPDTPQVLSIQLVGELVLQAGSPAQRARHLPPLAAGEAFASVLCTEPAVGSDLASLGTTAVRHDSGYELSGVKVYGLYSAVTEVGLAAARTGDPTSRYHGISLFLLDLTADGIRRSTIPGLADEQFGRVELERVRVAADQRLGPEGDGWALLTGLLALERTGLDYAQKSQRWFAAATAGLAPGRVDGALLAEIGRHGAQVDAARLLAWDLVRRLDREAVNPVDAAVAKYHTSRTAQEVATWAALRHGPGYRQHGLAHADRALLEAAYREAPGLTLASGTSEMMLELIASDVAAGALAGTDSGGGDD